LKLKYLVFTTSAGFVTVTAPQAAMAPAEKLPHVVLVIAVVFKMLQQQYGDY